MVPIGPKAVNPNPAWTRHRSAVVRAFTKVGSDAETAMGTDPLRKQKLTESELLFEEYRNVHGYTDIRKPPRIDPKYVEIGWRIVIGYDLEDRKELNGVIAARIKTLRAKLPKRVGTAGETLRRLA